MNHGDNVPPETRFHEYQVERLALGELSSDEQRELEARFGKERLAERKRTLEAENAAFLERCEPDRMVPEIERRAAREREQLESSRRRHRAMRHLAWSTPVLAAAAVLLSVWVGSLGPPEGRDLSQGMEEVTGIKGLDPSLKIYRRTTATSGTTEGFEILEDGDIARAGDLIQLGYVAAEWQYGVIVSLDGAGAVTLHWPSDPASSTSLEHEGEVLLERAYRLDDAPLFERFFFITSESPILVDQVIRSAQELATDPQAASEQPLDLPAGWEQISVTLRKEIP